MFDSLSKALESLKPGQIVKVLDRGPYREQLRNMTPPRDSGLVSDVGTQIEFQSWTARAGYTDEKPFFVCWELNKIVGFRLSGITFVAHETPRRPAIAACTLLLRTIKGEDTVPLIVDHCRVVWKHDENWVSRSSEQRPTFARAMNVVATYASAPVKIHRCFIDGHVDLDTYSHTTFSQNIIQARHTDRALSITPGLGQQLLVQENYLIGHSPFLIGSRQARKFKSTRSLPFPSYHFVNNYLEGRSGITVARPSKDAPGPPTATIERNVFNCTIPFSFSVPSDAAAADAVWHASDNVVFGKFDPTLAHSFPPRDANQYISNSTLTPHRQSIDASHLHDILQFANADRGSADAIGPVSIDLTVIRDSTREDPASGD